MVIVGVALLALVMAGMEVFAGPAIERTRTFTDVTAIDFRLANASVEVVAGSGDVVVDQTVHLGAFGGDASTRVQDGRLEIVLDCPAFQLFSLGRGCRGEYVVTAPSAILVTGTTDNGALRIDDMDGPVDVRTSNGAIDVAASSGRLDLHTSNGRISGTDLTSGVVTARTSNGAISLSFDTAPDEVVADTSNGAITIEVPDDGAPWAVDATTSNGQVRTEVATDPTTDRTLRLDTSNGSVDVRYSD